MKRRHLSAVFYLPKNMNTLRIIGSVVGGILLTIGFWLHPLSVTAPPLSEQQQPASLGTAIPKVIAVFTTSLQSAISSSDTSMMLVSGTDKAGNAISGYTCFNVDEGSVSEEFICGTSSSTSITSLLRGIDPVNGSLSVTALKKSHRRGATVKITNYPVEGILARILNGDDTAPNVLQYASSVTNAAISANGYNLVDVNLLSSTSFSGVSPANPTGGIAGIGMFSTQTQLANGTATSSYLGTTYSLFPWNAYFNATSSATTTVPVTGADGKLSSSFVATSSPYLWTASSTFSATSTFAGNTLFPGLTSNGVLIGGSTATTTAVAGGTVGNILQYNGTNWVATSSPGMAILTKVISTSNVAVASAASTTVASITLPSPTTSTRYVIRGHFYDVDGVTNSTSTLEIGGVPIVTCTVGNNAQIHFQTEVQFINSTSSEYVVTTVFGESGSCDGGSSFSVNVGSSPTLRIRSQFSSGGTHSFRSDYLTNLTY